MNADGCRRCALALNSYTRWSCGELCDMTVEELVDWYKTAVAMYK